MHEEWFKEALKDQDIDLIIVFGHVDIRSEEYAVLFSTIRSLHWDTPIQFFGGHTHIRDYKVFDAKAAALESGRYMETLGFASINGLSTRGTKDRGLRLCATRSLDQSSPLPAQREYLHLDRGTATTSDYREIRSHPEWQEGVCDYQHRCHPF